MRVIYYLILAVSIITNRLRAHVVKFETLRKYHFRKNAYVEGKIFKKKGEYVKWPICRRYRFESLLTRLGNSAPSPPKSFGTGWFLAGYEDGEHTWHTKQRLIDHPDPAKSKTVQLKQKNRLIQCYIYTKSPSGEFKGGSNVYGHCLGYIVAVPNKYEWNVAYEECAKKLESTL